MRILVVDVLIWLGLAGTCLGAQSLPAGKVQEIEKAITTEMSRQRIPALSVSIATEQGLAWSNGYGFSDLENFVPAKASTVYRLGSISKPITAIAAMQLVEQGKLDLNTIVQTYVPTFPVKPWPITPLELLGHLSGIRHYLPGNLDFDSTKHYASLTEALHPFENDPLLFEPGTKYSYTTYGYVLLGAVIEAASHERYREYVERHIFQPAGMDRIREDDVYAIIPSRARGYRMRPNGLENCALADTSNKIPGGGLAGTAADLAKFGLAVMKGSLVRKDTLDRMFTVQNTPEGKPTGYGLGWEVRDFQGSHLIGHGGGQQGITTRLMMVPSQGVVVAVMTNLEEAVLGRLTYNIGRIASDRK